MPSFFDDEDDYHLPRRNARRFPTPNTHRYRPHFSGEDSSDSDDSEATFDDHFSDASSTDFFDRTRPDRRDRTSYYYDDEEFGHWPFPPRREDQEFNRRPTAARDRSSYDQDSFYDRNNRHHEASFPSWSGSHHRQASPGTFSRDSDSEYDYDEDSGTRSPRFDDYFESSEYSNREYGSPFSDRRARSSSGSGSGSEGGYFGDQSDHSYSHEPWGWRDGRRTAREGRNKSDGRDRGGFEGERGRERGFGGGGGRSTGAVCGGGE